ncbi:MAG: cobalamin-dependent protein [Planctomycetota bacterium]
MSGFEGQHLVLATIENLVRAMSIRQLGAYAESMGIKTTLLFLLKSAGSYEAPTTFDPSEVSRIVAFLKKEQVTHLGFYLMTGSFKPYRALVVALREAGFEGMILAGGIHVTLCPEESLVEGAQFAVQVQAWFGATTTQM